VYPINKLITLLIFNFVTSNFFYKPFIMEDIFHESFNTIAFNLAKVKLKLGNTFLKFLFVAIER